MIDESIIGRLERVIDQKAENAARPVSQSTAGTVTRVESDGTVWVRLAGASSDTPCRTTTAAVKPGDSVQVEVGGGSARITGNVSAPATDDATAIKAQASAGKAIEDAGRARTAAQSAEASAVAALQSADTAATAADDAQADAMAANNAANGALTQLSVVENVVGALDWISGHATYQASTDLEVVPGKFYYERSGEGTGADPYVYTYVPSPTGSPASNGYYEVASIDEAVTNYIATHLALTDDGLWLVRDEESYKMLLASDGMGIYDDLGVSVAEYGSTARIGKANGMHVSITGDELALQNGNVKVAHIGIGEDGKSRLYIERAVVVDDLQFGDWQWMERDNRNMSLKWVGGSV